MQALSKRFPLNRLCDNIVSQVELFSINAPWSLCCGFHSSICTYHGATKFVMNCLNVVCGLLVTVYMSCGCSTQLAQYSNFMDVCMMTQD